jgi:hypothetical protein
VQITPTEAADRNDAKAKVSAISTAADQPTDREADYRCLNPLQRKTSKLEGDEEYTSIIRTLHARFLWTRPLQLSVSLIGGPHAASLEKNNLIWAATLCCAEQQQLS